MAVCNQQASFIADVGLVLLRNGAETYRTSETMEYIARTFDLKSFDIFVIPSTVMVSVFTKSGETSTVIRKITDRTLNLDRVARVNQLSREMVGNEYDFEEAQKMIQTIRQEKTGFSTVPLMAFAGLIGVGFAVMQNGNWAECIFAFIAAALVRLTAHLSSKVNQTRFLYEFLGAFCAAAIGVCAQELIDIIDRDIVIVGGIMPLVPGVAITNSIRDIINGDNLSGLVRGLEAALTSIAIAMGVLLMLSLAI